MMLPMTNLMDGRALAAGIEATLAARVDALKDQGSTPTLAILVVGHDERTASYIRAKQAAAERIGIAVKVLHFDETRPNPPGSPFAKGEVRQDRGISDDVQYEVTDLSRQISATIQQCNDDPSIHGIILQLPLPEGVDEHTLLNTVNPRKDVDGLTETNQAAVEMGRELFPPATPMGILRLLKQYGVQPEGTVVAVVGQGRVVGKPMADMLRSRGADVRTADSSTQDLGAITHGAAVIISATGQPGLITPDLVDNDVVLVDAGLAEVGTSLVGDITPEATAKARLATPTKGGVGPMTVVSLLSNVVVAAEIALLTPQIR